MLLVLLLALILPLQSFASAWNCGSPEAGSAGAHQHCAPGAGTLGAAASGPAALGTAASGSVASGPADTGDAQAHHHCGTCCAAAIAPQTQGWSAPHSTACGIELPQIGSPPNATLERLDRPPRLL